MARQWNPLVIEHTWNLLQLEVPPSGDQVAWLCNTGSTPQLNAEIREIHRVKPVVFVHQEKSIHIWRGKPTTRLLCRFTPRLGQRGTTALGHAAISYEFPNVGR